MKVTHHLTIDPGLVKTHKWDPVVVLTQEQRQHDFLTLVVEQGCWKASSRPWELV